MRKLIFLLALAMCSVSQMLAIPAAPYPVQKTQPDGSTLTVHINGDEFYHFYTTTDGYTVVKNELGCYTYAQRVEGRLLPTAIVAHNPAERNAAEQLYLTTLPKRLTDTAQVAEAKAEKAKRQVAPKLFDYAAFRGLIVLVQFNDYTFSRSDANQFYSQMVNQKGYTGFTNEDGSAANFGNFTGSVRDYYEENSNGMFAPTFDVVGPITVPYSITNSYSNLSIIMRNALNQVTSNYGVDYTNYDIDGDGYVDMVYLIFAGVGSNTGEADDHIWPHKSTTFVGRFRTYACSCEYLSERSNILDGIGTICHEFSHVLGLPDLYDTDYEQSGGQTHDPGIWDIMAGGGYNNNSRTPIGYSAYDRYSLGFLKPTVIDAAGTYTLNPLNTNNEAMLIKSPEANEYFLLENRQKSRWDAYAPGHGLIVARVDSSDASRWTRNTVNTNPERLYYELLRAGSITSGEGDPSDPFPGTSSVAMITNETDANLKTFSCAYNQWNIAAITETDGVISFNVVKEGDILSDVEDFEAMPVTATTGATDVEGKFANWTFTKCNVAAPGADTKADGTHSVQMKLPSQFTTSDTYYDAYQISAKVFNPGTVTMKFTLQYSTDEGATWNVVKVLGETSQTVKAGVSPTLYWPVSITRNQAVRYRLALTAGSKTVATYVDNFAIYYTAKGKPAGITGDINGDGVVNVSDVTALINTILGDASFSHEVCDINADGEVNVSDVTALINSILG
ncbi:MAG: M6 family metalloprotease domain-containing protein [Sodaliphilus sp.]